MLYDNEDNFIEKHIPFIIKVVADFLNRYVELENSEEYSIALEAFQRSMKTYDETKGNFYGFSKTVIRNSLIDYKRKESKVITLNLHENDSITDRFEDDILEKHELITYEEKLGEYGLTFESLIETGPKHMKTRKNLVEMAFKIYDNEEIMVLIREKKRLPITKVVKLFGFSIKVLKVHKKILLAIIVALDSDVKSVISWVKNI